MYHLPSSFAFAALFHKFLPSYYHLYSEGMWEGNVFTGVCPFTGEVPQSQVIFLIPGPWSQGILHPTPLGGNPVPAGGIPQSKMGVSLMGLEYPLAGARVLAAGTGVPMAGTGIPLLGLGYFLPPDSSEEPVLATQWAVCLLRSRRKTFLFTDCILSVKFLD